MHFKVKSRLGTMICRITVVDGAMKIVGMSHRFSPKGNQLFQNSLKVAGKKHANGMRKKVSLYYYLFFIRNYNRLFQPSNQNELHQQHMLLHNNHVMRAAGTMRKIQLQRILLDHPTRTLRV